MDRQFLEFWGNLLLNAAQGQKQLEELREWMRCGLSGFEELGSLFQKIYGLEGIGRESPDYARMWAVAQEDFRKSFGDYMALFGVVPREEHLELVKKYEVLKEKCESQDETIRHLRMLLSQAGKEEFRNLAGQFEELVRKQGDQFQKLMETFSRPFDQEDSSPGD